MPETHLILRRAEKQSASDYPFYQPGFLFNDDRHLRQQAVYPFVTLSALNVKTQQIDARCTLFRSPAGLISPAAAPFGSVEFAPSLPRAVLTDLVTALVEEAHRIEACSIQLVHHPLCYAPEQTVRLAYQLIEQGFYVAASVPNFHLPVTNQPFESVISAAERRRLRKCRRAGFRFEHWRGQDAHHADAITSFIADTRRRQQYRLTIPPEQLATLLEQFADEFLVFSVIDGKTIAALSVTVRISDTILYQFLPASSPDYAQFSPMVMLIDGLYTYCQRKAVQLLDLGTSLDGDGQPKPSLMRFKRNLGAQESPKLIFRKNLCATGLRFFP